MVADSKDSAVGLLIEECARMMSVVGAEGEMRDVLIYVADGNYALRGGQFVCEMLGEYDGAPAVGSLEFVIKNNRSWEARG